jgi:hypothetical protein
METVPPPKSDHATYDPPVLGHLGMRPGSRRYLEHTWVATEGSYVSEPPGEVHTLTVDDDCEEMQTFVVICGPVLYIDDQDHVVHVEDDVGLIELCKQAYGENGLGADFVDQFIR